MNRKPLIITSILIVIVSMVIGGFFLFFESYTKTEDLGWSNNAYQNQFLAAEKFLSSDNTAINIAHGFGEIESLDNIDTLIITNYSGVVSEKQEDTLLAWLSNGGNMILALPYYDFEGLHSKLLNQAGITSHQSELISDDINTELEESNVEPTDHLTTLSFDDVKDDLSIEFHRGSRLDHESFYYQDDEYEGYKPFHWSGDEQSIYFIQIYIDDGLLTVMSDASIWKNAYIADYDHAHLLFLLTESQKNVQFLTGSEFPDLITLIWKNAYELLLSIFALLLFWLLHRGKRFLPATKVSSTVRRSLNEHIEAVAKFHWKQKQTQRLLSSLREEVFKQHGLLELKSNNPHQKIIESLAQLTNIDNITIETALYSSNITAETEFIQAVQTLKTINSKL